MNNYQCSTCQHIYIVESGDPSNGIAPNTPFEDLPSDWVCPICGVPKRMFDEIIPEPPTQFEVRPLPYDYSALEPSISEQTLKLHHDKHYAGYIANVNKLIKGSSFAGMELRDIMLKSSGALFNNAAQAWNHEFYFEQFSPNPVNVPQERLSRAIDARFGSFEEFKKAVAESAMQLFGSGWVWFVVDDQTLDLSIVNESNGGNPLTSGLRPIMTIDVWEHAYYVDYENRRAESIDAFWNVVDWAILESRF